MQQPRGRARRRRFHSRSLPPSVKAGLAAARRLRPHEPVKTLASAASPPRSAPVVPPAAWDATRQIIEDAKMSSLAPKPIATAGGSPGASRSQELQPEQPRQSSGETMSLSPPRNELVEGMGRELRRRCSGTGSPYGLSPAPYTYDSDGGAPQVTKSPATAEAKTQAQALAPAPAPARAQQPQEEWPRGHSNPPPQGKRPQGKRPQEKRQRPPHPWQVNGGNGHGPSSTHTHTHRAHHVPPSLLRQESNSSTASALTTPSGAFNDLGSPFFAFEREQRKGSGRRHHPFEPEPLKEFIVPLLHGIVFAFKVVALLVLGTSIYFLRHDWNALHEASVEMAAFLHETPVDVPTGYMSDRSDYDFAETEQDLSDVHRGCQRLFYETALNVSFLLAGDAGDEIGVDVDAEPGNEYVEEKMTRLKTMKASAILYREKGWFTRWYWTLRMLDAYVLAGSRDLLGNWVAIVGELVMLHLVMRVSSVKSQLDAAASRIREAEESLALLVVDPPPRRLCRGRWWGCRAALEAARFWRRGSTRAAQAAQVLALRKARVLGGFWDRSNFAIEIVVPFNQNSLTFSASFLMQQAIAMLIALSFMVAQTLRRARTATLVAFWLGVYAVTFYVLGVVID
mmetsp:Transcript_42766/g.134084  ORF Transcript_42766/g.134084 Transcript_42766/m.134084 type:complete len:624 (-) Transcript_42766:1270-3141(-)